MLCEASPHKLLRRSSFACLYPSVQVRNKFQMLESLNGSEKSGKDLTMTRRIGKKETHSFGRVLVVLLTFLAVAFRISAQQVSPTPRTMSRLGTVDERFQSYNIEMVEVTG